MTLTPKGNTRVNTLTLKGNTRVIEFTPKGNTLIITLTPKGNTRVKNMSGGGVNPYPSDVLSAARISLLDLSVTSTI